ncbi:MAG: diguanylate cyclase [Candidatus Dormibacteria bacterium]
MRGVRWFRAVWRGASFSLKFAAVIFVAGATIAVVPLMLAAASARAQAETSIAQTVSIASNLIDGQRASLATFIADVGRQIAAGGDIGSTSAIEATLVQDTSVIGTDDVLGVVEDDGAVVAVRGSTRLGGASAASLASAGLSGATIAMTSGGGAWMVAASQVPGTAATAFVARPLTTAFIDVIDRNIATTAAPVGVLLIRDGRTLTIAGGVTSLTPALAGALPTQPGIVSLESHQFAVAAIPIGAGLTLAAAAPFSGPPVGWQSILLLLAVVLVAMLFIVVVVQVDLRRPLHRLDTAVTALGRGDFERPVHTGSIDEIGRLGASFEAMRMQVRSTMRITACRATVAMELSLAQPLEAALANVCAEMRRSMDVDMAMIVVNGSEMSDPFAVCDGGRRLTVDGFLEGHGPLGEGYRHRGLGAITLGATPAAPEASLEVREFCVAPLRLGQHVYGVLAVAGQDSAFTSGDSDLVASTAEQISLALERYRFLAVVQRQASVDDLTGLYNHRFLIDSLGQQAALAERLGAPLAILMLDIDHFKALNDTHGHHAGDVALSTFAHTVLGNVRRADLSARYGGEEFVVLMPNTSAREAFLVAEKIRRAVAHTDVHLPGRPPVRLSVSVGVAAYPEDTDSASDLFGLADEALYEAKRLGRDRTCMAAAVRGASSSRAVPSMLHDAQVTRNESNAGTGHRRPTE